MVSMTAACRIGICVAVAGGVGSFANSARVILPLHEISALISDILDPNHIIVDFDTELSAVRELPPGSQNQGDDVLRTHLKHVLEKRNGQWKVLSAQNTFVAGK